MLKGVINISRVKFDKEYSTSFKKEVEILKDNGIRYEFVKTINGISTYKYKKSKKLFLVLSSMYE